jgi:BNR repeat-containing family member
MLLRVCLTVIPLTILVAGIAAAPVRAATLPIRIDTTLSLREQFGYAPDYPLNIPSFDPANRPVIRSRTESQDVTRSAFRLTDDGSWAAASLLKAVKRSYPSFTNTINAGGYVSERVEFDTQGRAYTLLEIRVRSGRVYNVLLYSVDGCRSWRLVTLPFGGKPVIYDGRDNGTAALEQYAGWNASSRPPLVAVWRPVSDWPGDRASRSLLYVIKPSFSHGLLRLPPPTLVSTRFIGQCYGAGGASFAASAGATSFIAWAEVARSTDPGTPTYVCSFDQTTRRLSTPVLVAEARKRNDDHDAPGIVRDGNGYLHVVTGAHNAQFLYTHSLEPRDASAWTAAEPMLAGGYVEPGGAAPGTARQTYLSLACLPDDSLVMVFRQVRCGVDPDFDGAAYDALCCQIRSPDGSWSEPQRLVQCADRTGYACFHQKLTVDRLGRLYLSLSYFSPLDYPAGERAAHRFTHRMVLTSKDGGRTWDFAATSDFREGIATAAG